LLLGVVCAYVAAILCASCFWVCSRQLRRALM
jgi:hypothetical protein